MWFHKKLKLPYLSVVEGKFIQHPALLQENRSRMKILLLDSNQDLPMDTLRFVLIEALNLAKVAIAKNAKLH